MLETLSVNTGFMPLFSCLLLWSLLGVIICLGLAVIQLKGLAIQSLTKPKQLIMLKYKSYLQRWNHWSKGIQSIPHSRNKLILYGLNCIVLNLVFQSNIAFCQTDTLTKPQKDSLAYFYLPFIIADLKDYDLLKQKSVIQEKQIKGLQAISTNQKNLSVRQSIKIEGYSNSLLKVQTDNYTLQTNLATTKKQRNLARLENWLWRGGAIYLIGKILKFY